MASARKEHALKVISEKHVVEGRVSDAAKAKAIKIVKSLGPYCESLVFAPNWNYNSSNTVPSGYSLQVTKDAPLLSDIFHARKMHTGVSLYNLGNKVMMRDGTKLTEDKLHTSHLAFSSEIGKFIHEISSTPLDLSYLPASGSVTDNLSGKEAWSPALGTGSAFAGIFTSFDNTGSNYFAERNYWLGVSAGAPSCSEDLYARLCDAQEGGKTTLASFFDEPATRFSFDAGARNRSRLLAGLAKAFNIESKFVSDTAGFASDTKVNLSHFDKLDPHVETITNRVVSTTGGSRVFHSNTVDPQLNSGVIIAHNPYVGVTILKGKPSSHRAFGDPWQLAPGSAFPVCTGRLMSKPEIRRKIASDPSLLESIANQKDSQHLTVGNSEDGKLKLVPHVYRMRTDVFRQKERDMGYGQWQEEISLRPLILKIAES